MALLGYLDQLIIAVDKAPSRGRDQGTLLKCVQL